MRDQHHRRSRSLGELNQLVHRALVIAATARAGDVIGVVIAGKRNQGCFPKLDRADLIEIDDVRVLLLGRGDALVEVHAALPIANHHQNRQLGPTEQLENPGDSVADFSDVPGNDDRVRLLFGEKCQVLSQREHVSAGILVDRAQDAEDQAVVRLGIKERELVPSERSASRAYLDLLRNRGLQSSRTLRMRPGYPARRRRVGRRSP